MSTACLDDLPGFRRRFRIAPGEGGVMAAVEDDFHCMAVTLRHDGAVITGVEARTIRAPWTTCPGAVEVLVDTFTGSTLDAAARRGLKQANCTHLYDLAVLAAGHAGDAGVCTYDVLVGDPVDGITHAEIRRNGAEVLRLTISGFTVIEPEAAAGKTLLQLRDWISALPATEREAGKILQWASLIAHGRQLPLEHQSDATRMPPNCYTFQPDMARKAVRVGEIIDFSQGEREPLAAI